MCFHMSLKWHDGGELDGMELNNMEHDERDDVSAPPAVSPNQRRFSQNEIIRRIRAFINDGEYLIGQRVGSERVLAERLGISRSDLRTALASMESSHEIRRKIGRKGGITVADERLERNINTMESLPVIARRQGFVLSSRVLAASITPASPSDTRSNCSRCRRTPHSFTFVALLDPQMEGRSNAPLTCILPTA